MAYTEGSCQSVKITETGAVTSIPARVYGIVVQYSTKVQTGCTLSDGNGGDDKLALTCGPVQTAGDTTESVVLSVPILFSNSVYATLFPVDTVAYVMYR